MEPELWKRREHRVDVARRELAREVRVPPRARRRTGLHLTLSLPAEAAARATTDMNGRREVTAGIICKLKLPHT